MVEKITQIILTIGILVFSIKFFVKGYKESKSDLEKIVYVMLPLAIMFPVVVYYLDRYNIPSKLGYTENIISSDWVSILTNYSATIFSTLLSAVFLIFITFKQMDETYKDNIKLNNKVYKDNIKLNNETQRIQNLPLLRYNFIQESLEGEMFDENKKCIFSNQDYNNIDSIDFTMEIENIGLNTVRKVYLEVESELFNKKETFELWNQSNIKKNQIKKKEFIIPHVAKGIYKIDITVYYQDLLKNWYKQKVHLTISVTNIYDSNTNSNNQINSVVVDDEEMLINEPSVIKNTNKN